MKWKYFTIWTLVFFLNISGVASALDPKEELANLKAKLESDISTTSMTQCRNVLVPAYDLELVEFLKFLETNFQNKSANSSLTNTAIRRYSEFRLSIRQKFNKLQPGLSIDPASVSISEVIGEGLVPFTRLGSDFKPTGQEEIAAYQACSKITDSYLDLAKNRMVEQIKTTSAQKRTTIMVEKYKAINTRLRDLNTEISRMYGYFMTFKSKLPGFLQECVTS